MAFNRFIQGDCNVRPVYVQTAKAVDIGQPVGIAANGDLTTPSDTAWNTDLATTQTDFASVFAGASNQKKVAGSPRVYGNSADNALMISPTGEFEATLQASASVVNGVTFLGPAKHPSTNTLIDTALVVVATAARAIAVATETKTGTAVKAQLLSARFPLGK